MSNKRQVGQVITPQGNLARRGGLKETSLSKIKQEVKDTYQSKKQRHVTGCGMTEIFADRGGLVWGIDCK